MRSKAIASWSRKRRTGPSRPGTKALILLAACLLLVFCGCAQKLTVYKPITLQKPPQPAQTAADKSAAAEKAEKKELPGHEALQAPAYEREPAKTPLSEKKPPAKEPFDFKRLSLTKTPVTINVQNMPLSDFVIYALGETMKIAFVMDEKIMANKEPVTLRMPEAMAADKALEIVVGLFEKHGIFLDERAGALYILSKPPQPPPPDAYSVKIGRNVSDSPGEILQIVPLKHSRFMEIEPILKEVSRTSIQIKSSRNGNILYMYGRAEQIRKVLDVLETFDIPYFEGKKLYLLRFTYMKADDFINELKIILTGLGYRVAAAAEDPGPLFLHLRQLNAVLLVSPDDKTSRYVLEWKDKLDTAESAGAEERAFSYMPKYTKASDLVKSIQTLYGIAAPADPAQKAGAQKPAAAGQTVSQSGMKISADDGRNIVVVVGTPLAYKVILSLLKDMDIPPRQVLIEATVVELTLTDELKYGVEWYLRNNQEKGIYTLGTLGKLGLSPLGLAYQFVSDTSNVQALVSAMATQNRANILSTPRLMVLDNKEATIQIGSDVPTVTGEISTTSTTTTAPNVLRNIAYRNTGVMLRVKPTINTDGMVTLDIGQEVSQPGAPGVGDSPVILTRRLSTSVIVGHGQTIALGGLMKDNEGEATSKVPIIGDIPLIGNLFKYTSKTKEKTELLILVTPTILTTMDDSVKITEELKKELKWLKQ